jgi:multicomponent Na+:H+ antiporter subunit B
MDAPDVAMTEVALGACLSTCVFLNFLKISNSQRTKLKLVRLFSSIIICVLLVAILTWASIDIAKYGLIDSPIHQDVAKYYIENTVDDMGIPSPVAAILASYRGYDTLGETCVILIAGIAVLLILSVTNKSNK